MAFHSSMTMLKAASEPSARLKALILIENKKGRIDEVWTPQLRGYLDGPYSGGRK